MFPNDQQSNPGNPASLPAMPAMPQLPQQAAGPAPMPTPQASQLVASEDAAARAAAQARQLISQYGGDPYKLSEALNQLKAVYLADQYHVTPNQAEN
jgi:hypothetical protein